VLEIWLKITVSPSQLAMQVGIYLENG